VIVPEPGSLALAGIAAAAWAAGATRSCFTDGIWGMLMVPAEQGKVAVRITAA